MINLACSAINLVFIVYYRPYLSRMTNVVSGITEFGIFSIFALCASFEYEYDTDTSRTIMWTGISLICAVMAVNLVEMIYMQTLWLIDLCKRWKARSVLNRSMVDTMKDTVKRHLPNNKRFTRDTKVNPTLG